MSESRAIGLAAIFAVTLAVIAADFTTSIERDVATIYGLPLVLCGATRNRSLLWALTGSLITATFLAYALQIPAGSFSLTESFFGNRVLNAVSLLLLAGLLHLWMNAAATREAQAELIREQDEKLQSAGASRRMVEVQEAERRALASQLHDLVGQKLTALSINLTMAESELASAETARPETWAIRPRSGTGASGHRRLPWPPSP